MIQQFSINRTMFTAGLCALMLVFSSCYSYRVATHAQAGTGLSKPVTAHAFFLGAGTKAAPDTNASLRFAAVKRYVGGNCKN